MSLAIVGMGTAVPSTEISQEDSAGIARRLCCRTPEQQTWLPLMYENTGIQTRHMAVDVQVLEDLLQNTTYSHSPFLPSGRGDDRGPTTGERLRYYADHAGVLAVQPASEALTQSRLDPSEITHLVTVSCTGMRAPGVDYDIIDGLGLAPTVQRTHVGFMGCHGAINGLRVAQAFVDADPDACVLVCAVELCVLHYFYGWEPQKVIANALFSDGAAAVVGVPDRMTPAGTWRVTTTGSCIIPNSREVMSWTVGDHGFEMTLSKRVPGLIQEHLRPWMKSWLGRRGLSIELIGSWAIHPGGPAILDAAAEALDLDDEQLAAARAVFAANGNMSSPTVLFIIDLLRSQDAPLPCVALGFGPGLIAEAALIQ
ncbi:MAG TPA: type III polyketide synthase [Gemmataceae bacterium]|nr:type III polyketide synthase [Gemmataceae bacterium]